MVEITGPSGAKIVINPAPWKDAKELKKAVERTLGARGFDFKKGIGEGISLFLQADGSDEVEEALWPCLARCLRDKEKITVETFDDVAARRDYYEIVLECIKVNFGPLAESLASKLPFGLLGAKPTADATQKSI
jgi:hypothetical protein